MTERRLDEVDRRILDHLVRDARTSNRRIAQALDVTEGTVRARIRRMEEKNQIRITAVTNIRRLANPMLAFLRVEVERGSHVRDVAEALARDPRIGFVAIMVGRFAILAITLVQSTEQLSVFLHGNVYTIPGVRHVECSVGARFVKHDHRISRIVPRDAQGEIRRNT